MKEYLNLSYIKNDKLSLNIKEFKSVNFNRRIKVVREILNVHSSNQKGVLCYLKSTLVPNQVHSTTLITLKEKEKY